METNRKSTRSIKRQWIQFTQHIQTDDDESSSNSSHSTTSHSKQQIESKLQYKYKYVVFQLINIYDRVYLCSDNNSERESINGIVNHEKPIETNESYNIDAPLTQHDIQQELENEKNNEFLIGD